MSRINSLGVILTFIILIAVGCSTTQEKPPIEKTPMMIEGQYRIRNTITESNCMMPDLSKGVINYNTVNLSQNEGKLVWGQFFIGNVNYGVQYSKLEGNQAQFTDMKTNFDTSILEWNATILFSNDGFSGTGDFQVYECEGIFRIIATRIE